MTSYPDSAVLPGARARAGWMNVGCATVLAAVSTAATHDPSVLMCLVYVAVVTPHLWRIDLAEHRLPNEFVSPGYVMVLVTLALLSIRGMHEHVIVGLVCGFCSLLTFGVLHYAGGMGMGDVKLAGILGACAGFLGVDIAVASFVLAFVSGGLTAASVVVGGMPRSTRIPFGPFLLAGFWVAVTLSVTRSGPTLIEFL